MPYFTWVWQILNPSPNFDLEVKAFVSNLGDETQRKLAWLHSRIQQASPQALVVAT